MKVKLRNIFVRKCKVVNMSITGIFCEIQKKNYEYHQVIVLEVSCPVLNVIDL